MSATLTVVKSHASYREQIQNLIDNDLEIMDPAVAEEYLKKVNYYRFSGYTRFFKDSSTGKFVVGTTIEMLYRLYDFDRRLRQLIMGQLEIVEVMFRSRISYRIADMYGSLGHLDKSNFLNSDYHTAFVKDLSKETERSSKVTFVAHHMNRYAGQLPIWVAVEVMSFGTLSKLYSNMLKPDKKAIAKEFGVPSEYIESWLRHFCLIRNVCAHYSRIYGRSFSTSPKIYKRDHDTYFSNWITQQRTFYATLYVLRKLFHADVQWSSFVVELEALLEEYKDVVTLTEIGLESNWVSKLQLS